MVPITTHPSTTAPREFIVGLCYRMFSDSIRMFSPVPERVMDGSEPGDSVAAAVLSGAPLDLQARTVR